jgi:hypothetical protein
LEQAPKYPPGPGMPGGGSAWNKDAYQPQTTGPAQQSGPGIVDVWNKDRMTGPAQQDRGQQWKPGQWAQENQEE